MAEIVGKRGAQRIELAVGIAVDLTQRDGDPVEDVVGDLLRNRVGVLIDIQRDRHACLRSPVGDLSPEIVAERKVFEGCAHPSHATTRGQRGDV